MNNWWSLGEGFGQRGTSLPLYQIGCAFCGEEGNFELEHHAEKRKANSSKTLNFDTYKCGNCAGYVMVLWSASEHGGLVNYKCLPWQTGKVKAPEYWPKEVQRFWKQAHESVNSEIWDGGAVMIRSALQIALRKNGAVGKDLRAEIKDLGDKGILPPVIQDWANELRFLGNDSAHPEADLDDLDPASVKEALEFLDYLLRYLYDLPHQIEEYRSKKKKA
ncbi:MAG TPA: DUF4145 domain-containing protein [Candidatus Paceibacterota bacterium]|jgi:hypothetical protein